MSEGFFVFVFGVVVGVWFSWLATYGVLKGSYEEKVSRGEIACEVFHGQRICWNPKEEGE